MAYSKQNFKSGDTLRASQLNAMDEQISKNESECARLSGAIADRYTKAETDAIMGAYVNEIAALIGGDANADS